MKVPTLEDCDQKFHAGEPLTALEQFVYYHKVDNGRWVQRLQAVIDELVLDLPSDEELRAMQERGELPSDEELEKS